MVFPVSFDNTPKCVGRCNARTLYVDVQYQCQAYKLVTVLSCVISSSFDLVSSQDVHRKHTRYVSFSLSLFLPILALVGDMHQT